MPKQAWMEWNSHPLSEALQQVVRQLDDGADAIVEQIVHAYHAALPTYTAPEILAAENSVRDTARYFVRTFHQALLDARSPLTPERLNVVASYARERITQKVALGDLLRARQLCGHIHWALILDAVRPQPELYGEVLHLVSHNMLCYLEAHYQVGYQVYATEDRVRLRWRERLRSELCALILSRPDDLKAFQSRAQALLLDDAAPHCALALRLRDSGDLGWESVGLREDIAESLAALAGVETDTLLHAVYHGHLLVWLPLPRGEGAFDSDRRLAEIAGGFVQQEDRVAAIGVGLPGMGARGWGQSAQQALKAIEAGLRLAERLAVHHYSDIVLDDAITRSDNSLRYFESLLARLAAEPNLLQTLRVYFELRQQRKTVATALGIHPNTLDYRLERIESVLGVGLDNVAWIAKLQIALRLHGSAPQDGERAGAA